MIARDVVGAKITAIRQQRINDDQSGANGQYHLTAIELDNGCTILLGTTTGYLDSYVTTSVVRHKERQTKVDTCHFCGTDGHPIHEESWDQYGEPVCVPCFEASYKPDP